MFNQEEIFVRVRAGQILPTWRVFQPRRSYFIKTIVTYVFLALLCIASLFYMNYRHVVFVPGYSSDPLSSDEFHIWQIIDYATDGIFLLITVIGFFNTLFDMSNANKQLLVLTPEGFIMQKSHAAQVVAYASVASMKANIYRSNVGLAIKLISGGKDVKIGFDGRFGDARQITTGIIHTQRAYAVANMQRIIQ